MTDKLKQFHEEVLVPMSEKLKQDSSVSTIVLATEAIENLEDTVATQDQGLDVLLVGNDLTLGVMLGTFLLEQKDAEFIKIAMNIYNEFTKQDSQEEG